MQGSKRFVTALRICRLPSDVWKELARQEAERAAPDDPGFAEMWLVVARGRVAESRDSIRQAWESVERMTRPERAIESGIDLIDDQRIRADTTGISERFTTVISICDAVSDGIQRSEYLADLAGLAKALGNQRLYEETLAKSLESCNPRKERRNNNADIMRCRAMSWSSDPRMPHWRLLEDMTAPHSDSRHCTRSPSLHASIRNRTSIRSRG